MLNLNERLYISQIVNNMTMKSEVSLPSLPPLDTILSQFYPTPMLSTFACVPEIRIFTLYLNQQNALIKLE
jgi:hypothetical protein